MLAPEGYTKCIYTTPSGLCPGTSPLHPKEHYLPAGLENFRNNINLKNYICFDCQKRFSQLEAVFLQNGTEVRDEIPSIEDLQGVVAKLRHELHEPKGKTNSPGGCPWIARTINSP
jgi:hypothetical protein